MKVRRLNMFKHFINYHLRAIALSSIVFALAGAALATPSPAAAADCSTTLAPVQCVAVTVVVFDSGTGAPVNDAKVVLIDAYGNASYAYESFGNPVNDGRYIANVTPGTYKIYVDAMRYEPFATTASIKPVKGQTIKAPLVANSLDANPAPTLSAPASVNW